MYQKNDNQLGRRFLQEALPLVSTYFSGESVELAGMATPVGDDLDYESREFGDHIRFRHAIACCAELFPIVQRIETNLSCRTETIRTETKGVLRGRLDIPLYVSKRTSSLSWPKTYPILVTADTPNTPENALVLRIFRALLQRLSVSSFPINSAETKLSRRYRSWILGRMRRDPWSTISASSSLHRLYLEASRRISRRQTGNETAYSDLVRFVRDWRLVGDDLAGATSSERFIESLLSFPASQVFFDRIYEVWCIRAIGHAFMQLGANLIIGPTAMTESRRQPIYAFELEKNQIEVWFQKSLPSDEAEWMYESTGTALRGIPDISVVANGSHRILIDAKNRLVTGTTRSEETYKMLGYFENFGKTLKEGPNWGVLAFVSFNGFSRTLKSSNGRHLELLSAHPSDSEQCSFANSIKCVLEKWIFSLRTE